MHMNTKAYLHPCHYVFRFLFLSVITEILHYSTCSCYHAMITPYRHMYHTCRTYHTYHTHYTYDIHNTHYVHYEIPPEHFILRIIPTHTLYLLPPVTICRLPSLALIPVRPVSGIIRQPAHKGPRSSNIPAPQHIQHPHRIINATEIPNERITEILAVNQDATQVSLTQSPLRLAIQQQPPRHISILRQNNATETIIEELLPVLLPPDINRTEPFAHTYRNVPEKTIQEHTERTGQTGGYPPDIRPYIVT